MCFHSDINILPIFKIEACTFLAPKINNQLTVVSKQLGSCLLAWGAIQGPQGDLAGAESCCHPPSPPFLLLIFLQGVLFHTTQHTVFITPAPSRPYLITQSHHVLLQHEASHSFEVTNLATQPVSYECLWLAQGAVVLAMTSLPILLLFLNLSSGPLYTHFVLLSQAQYK